MQATLSTEEIRGDQPDSGRLRFHFGLTPYGMCKMSATHRLPTVNWSLVEILIAFRLSLKLTFVVLSTFMIAFPASFTNASLSWAAWLAPTKLL